MKRRRDAGAGAVASAAASAVAGDANDAAAGQTRAEYWAKRLRKNEAEQARVSAAAASGGLPQFFAGVRIYIDGSTKPSAEELRPLIVAHGGTVDGWWTSAVTHVVASVLPAMKLAKVAQAAPGRAAPVVRADWVPACVAAGRVLDARAWRLEATVDPSAAALASFVGLPLKAPAAAAAAAAPPPRLRARAPPAAAAPKTLPRR